MFSGVYSSDPLQAVWAGEAEKAVIEMSAIGDIFITNIKQNSYAAIDAGGFVSQALQTLTGRSTTFCNVSTLSKEEGLSQITAALNDDDLVVFNSHIKNNFGLLTGHSLICNGWLC